MCGKVVKMLSPGDPVLKAFRVPAADAHWTDVKPRFEFPDPLVHQVRGATKDGGAIDLAAIEKLARNQGRLDGLAHAHVVRDEQAHGVLLKRREKKSGTS